MPTYPFRSALVTGASSGIGEVIAELLAADGVRTYAVARRADRLDALARRHPSVIPLVADLTCEQEVSDTSCSGIAEVIDLISSEQIDLVVNNAGFGTSGSFHELDVDRLGREIALNVAALTRLSHASLRGMIPRRRGWLLNVSSVAGFQPAPHLAVYAATKAYVTNLTESLHEEAAPHGVHVTALCPGLTRTEFQRVSNADRYANRYPAAAWTSADEVATTGLDAVVANRALAVPGRQYKAMVALSGVTPRWVLRRASSRLRRG